MSSGTQSASETSSSNSAAAWRQIVSPFQQPSTGRAAWQIANTFGLYALLWTLMYWSLSVSWWLTIPLAVLSWTYVARSLSPAYTGERLSSTGWSRDVIGPPTIGPTALSLLPVRLTPWTRFWTELMLLGWRPGRALFVAGYPYGLASFVVAGWLYTPGVVGAAVWGVVVAVLVVATVVLLVRAFRQRVSGRPAPRAAAGS